MKHKKSFLKWYVSRARYYGISLAVLNPEGPIIFGDDVGQKMKCLLQYVSKDNAEGVYVRLSVQGKFDWGNDKKNVLHGCIRGLADFVDETYEVTLTDAMTKSGRSVKVHDGVIVGAAKSSQERIGEGMPEIFAIGAPAYPAIDVLLRAYAPVKCQKMSVPKHF